MTVYELIRDLTKLAYAHGPDVPVVIRDADTGWQLNIETVEYVDKKKAVRCPTCSRVNYNGNCITPAHVFIEGDYWDELKPELETR